MSRILWEEIMELVEQEVEIQNNYVIDKYTEKIILSNRGDSYALGEIIYEPSTGKLYVCNSSGDTISLVELVIDENKEPIGIITSGSVLKNNPDKNSSKNIAGYETYYNTSPDDLSKLI